MVRQPPREREHICVDVKSTPPVSGGVLLLDKPAGMTSTRALARARRLLGIRKAGHTGTLDPFATGLLPLAFGEATKFSRFLLDARKSYEATLRLGDVTTTGDPESEVVSRRPVLADDARIDAVLDRFIGVQQQVPPMHSALHHEGRRLYEWARSGIEVERPARRIEVHSLARLARRGDDLCLAVCCSKGTYVRSLAQDIGEALGCGAYLIGLRRTSVGPFTIEQAESLEELESTGVGLALEKLLAPESLVQGLPVICLAQDDAERVLHGQTLPEGRDLAAGEVALFGPDSRFLGVGRCEGAGRVVPVRLMVSANRSDSPDFA